ncbi:hypothetical protein [Hufsiella ginkgonis]|uniref:YfhE family protein n=1 Tax=Hufsiella ginkgonis TaxID=2695274 RepID=A0A7K1XYN5_9SPHI|nr:hypothetical protein [Hufsiella ginkgonis]MXV16114.1 hypothetical protein [Hufsiella ginkgonis]
MENKKESAKKESTHPKLKTERPLAEKDEFREAQIRTKKGYEKVKRDK